MASATTSKLWHNGRIKIEATEPLSFGDFFGGNLHPLEGNGDNYSIFDFSGEDEQSPPRENSLENTQNPAATTTITTTTTTTTTATEVNPIGNIPSSPEREEEEGDNESRQSTPIITRARTRANEVAVPQPVPSLNPSGRTSQWKCKTLWGPNRPFPQHLKLLLDSWRANEPKKRPECCFRCFRVTRPSKTFNRNGQLMDLTNYEIWDPLHYQVLVLHDPRTDQSNIVTVAGHGKNCTWLSRWLGPGKGWDSATIAARIFGPRLQDIVYPKGCFAKPSTSILDEKNVGTKSVPKKGQAKQQPQSKRRRLPTSTQTRTEAIQETDSSEESEEEVDSTSESGSSEEDEGDEEGSSEESEESEEENEVDTEPQPTPISNKRKRRSSVPKPASSSVSLPAVKPPVQDEVKVFFKLTSGDNRHDLRIPFKQCTSHMVLLSKARAFFQKYDEDLQVTGLSCRILSQSKWWDIDEDSEGILDEMLEEINEIQNPEKKTLYVKVAPA